MPPPPTPTKKTTLSSAVADRLSKPTAASLSRARTPSSAPPPARGTAKPAARGGATRGTPRVVSSGSTRAKKDAPSMSVADTAAATAVTVTMATTAAGVGIAVASESDPKPDQEQEQEVYHENGHQEDGHPENGHAGIGSQEEEIRESVGVEGPEVAGRGDVVEPEEEVLEHHEQGLSEADAAMGDVELLQPRVVDPPVVAEAEQEQEQEEPQVEEEVTLIHVQDTSTTSSSDTQFVPEETTETKLQLHIQEGNGTGGDIEQMVHLLESSIPKARPLSIVSIPDDVHEIPDEE